MCVPVYVCSPHSMYLRICSDRDVKYSCLPFGAQECKETPLICAAKRGRADCMRLLLNAGADTNAKDYNFHTVCGWSLVAICVVLTSVYVLCAYAMFFHSFIPNSSLIVSFVWALLCGAVVMIFYSRKYSICISYFIHLCSTFLSCCFGAPNRRTG
jgi:hypothetical protein